jgi:hypothetical protein
MAHLIAGNTIDRVVIIDDSADSRETLSDELRFAQFTPQALSGPFLTKDDLVKIVGDQADAVVCDHHLNTRNYAPCSGAEVVATWYERHIPSVMVSKWIKADIDQIRRYRRHVPVLLTPEEASDTGRIAKGFEICIEEFRDNFLPSRKPWKTLIRIEDVDITTKPPMVYAVIPGWNSNEIVRFPIDIIPKELHQVVAPGERFFALVNTGAETQEELYFEQFEYRGK